MNKKMCCGFIVVLGLTLGCACGQDARIDSDRYRESLKPQGFVSDWAGVFSAEQKADLDNRLAALKQANGAELSVVVLKTLQGGEINDFAAKLFAQWGIGQKGKDNGVLLLAAIDDHKMRIEVGYGLEGVLNDAKSGRIQDEYIIPRFKEGNYAQGLSDGVDALVKVMGGGELPEGAVAEEGSLLGGIIFLVFFAVIFLLIVRAAIRGGKGGGWTSGGGSRGGGWSSGSGGGGFGGFGGGRSGGGGASRGW